MGEEISDSESVVAIGEEKLALLIKTSIQALKIKNKKCGRKEVFNLVNESIEYKISLETINETLNSLIENETVTLNRECISLPIENIQEIDTEKEDVNGHFHQFKNDFLDEYREFKSKFLHEVKSFKDTIVNATPKTTGNQEQIITLLLDIIAFLKDQIRQKDKVIDSLINQSSQQNNYLLQKKSTDGQLETILKEVQSKERLKSEETEKIRTTENKSKRKDAEEKDLENNLEKRASHNENSDPDILQEPTYSEPRTEPTDLSNSIENRENNNEKEEISTQQKQATFPGKDVTQRFNRKRPSYDKKSVVILGDSMTKLLNGWDMAKKIQTNCKTFIKICSGATVSCMEDYMKPSLRNPPDHFILHVGTNDLSSDKSTHKIAESIINLACQLKSKKHDVSVSAIILRTDDKILNESSTLKLNI